MRGKWGLTEEARSDGAASPRAALFEAAHRSAEVAGDLGLSGDLVSRAEPRHPSSEDLVSLDVRFCVMS